MKGENMLSKDVSIRRLRGLRDFVRKIPWQLFDLDSAGTHTIARDIKKHGGVKNVFARPMEAGECGSVGCIAGWGCSMPEYRAWATKRGIKPAQRLHLGFLAEYPFGFESDMSPRLFDSALGHHEDGKGHKTEALERIAETIKMVKAGDL